MKKNFHFYLKLFLSTFYLSAFTFGGGYVIVGLMRQKFVDAYGWIDEKEMIDIAAIAQSAPGAIAVNASILVGYRLAGVPGAMVTILGTITPPLLILSVISLFYTAFKESRGVNLALRGMGAGVAAVICDVVWKMGKDVAKEGSAFSIVLMVLSFAAAFFFDVNVMLIIVSCGAAGLFYTFWRQKRHKEEGGA